MCAAKSRRTRRVSESCLVRALDQIACLLEFNREKVSRRGVDALNVGARRLRRAVGDVVGPEVPATLIGLAIQKIQVMESDKESGRVDGIQAISHVVVGNGYGSR